MFLLATIYSHTFVTKFLEAESESRMHDMNKRSSKSHFDIYTYINILEWTYNFIIDKTARS